MVEHNPKVSRRARIARERWRSANKQNIDMYHMMHEFIYGQQWTKDEEDDMIKTFRKTPLTANKLATMANTLLGEQQQNTAQIEVVPMSGCDEHTINYRELIIKDIIFSNDADTVIQVAAKQAAVGGAGAYCIDTDYCHENSFDLDICFRHHKDATRFYFDLGAEHINKIDGLHAGYDSRMTRDRFRQEYGKDIEEEVLKTSEITQSTEEIALATEPNNAFGEDPFTWIDDDSVSILDHYERQYKKVMLYKLSNGRTVEQSELDELIENSKKKNAALQMMHQQEQMQQMMQQQSQEQGGGQQQQPGPQEDILAGLNGMPQQPQQLPQEQEPENPDVMTIWDDDEPVRIEDKKEIRKYKVMHYKICGEYILDKSEFPSQHLPIIFMDNNSHYTKDGKQIWRSFFGDAVDSQRYINYIRTQCAYLLKISRWDQWIGSKKNVASIDTQRNWRDPTAVQGMLTFDESPSGIRPEQVRMPELSQSLFQQYQTAIDDLYTCTGLYPAHLGSSGDEASGKAINARTRQGSYATYVYFNSIKRAQAAGGVIVNEMIPKVYDTERVLSLMTPDGRQSVTVNKEDDFGNIENDIRKGTYLVRILPGPSYQQQKQEALQSLQAAYQIDPSTFRMTADLFADNLPLSNTIEIRNRFKTMVPPEIIEAGKSGKNPTPQGPTPEQQQMQMQQQAMQMKAQEKQKELELKAQEIQLKQQQIAMEAQFKIQELETQRVEAASKLQEQILRYKAESERTQIDSEMSHADNIVRILTHKI